MIILVRHCYKLSLYAILRKANEPNSKNGQKPSARLNFSSFWPKFGPPPQKKNCFVGFISTRCYELLQDIILCNFKEK